MITKKAVTAFGKKVYLLGRDDSGVLYWLEGPSWDCDWYWGFGYVETYTNNRQPQLSRDISSHSHFDGLVFIKGSDNEYIHTINDKNCILTETVLTDNEAWELSDLMKRFYILKEAAEVFHSGTANFTSATKVKTKDEVIEGLIISSISQK